MTFEYTSILAANLMFGLEEPAKKVCTFELIYLQFQWNSTLTFIPFHSKNQLSNDTLEKDINNYSNGTLDMGESSTFNKEFEKVNYRW